MEMRMEGKKSCWLRFWALILRWVMLKTRGFPLIIKRDKLLVSAWERLASCPAGFTHRPNCFTSKTHEIHCRHVPADLEQGSETYTCANPHSSCTVIFPFSCVCLSWWNLAAVDISPFFLSDINESSWLQSLQPQDGIFAHLQSWKMADSSTYQTLKGWDSSFNFWHFFGFLLT